MNMKQLIIFLSIFCIGVVHASDVIINSINLDVDPTPNPTGERFFVVQKSNILLPVYSSNYKEYEKIIGSMKEKRASPIDWVPLAKVPEFNLRLNSELIYFDSADKQIRKYSVPEKLKIQLIEESQDSDDFYTRWTLLLSTYTDETHISGSQYRYFDSVAYIGKKFKFKPSLKEIASYQKYSEAENFIGGLESDCMKRSKENLGANDLNKAIFKFKGINFYRFVSNKNDHLCTYAKLKDGTFFHWSANSVRSFGDEVEGSEFTAVIEGYRQYFYLIFFKDHVEKYFAGSFP